jgi:hypothetical protein
MLADNDVILIKFTMSKITFLILSLHPVDLAIVIGLYLHQSDQISNFECMLFPIKKNQI